MLIMKQAPHDSWLQLPVHLLAIVTLVQTKIHTQLLNVGINVLCIGIHYRQNQDSADSRDHCCHDVTLVFVISGDFVCNIHRTDSHVGHPKLNVSLFVSSYFVTAVCTNGKVLMTTRRNATLKKCFTFAATR